MCGAETWKLWTTDQKYLESFETWYWRRMEISWSDRFRNEEVLDTDKEENNILHTVKRRKASWIGHIFCENSPLKHTVVTCCARP